MWSLCETRYFDKPWKITIWILIFLQVLRIPWDVYQEFYIPILINKFGDLTIWILGIIGNVNFIISTIIVGFLYTDITEKIMDKEFRLKTCLYYTVLTNIYVASKYIDKLIIFRSLFIKSLILDILIKFLIIYNFLLLGYKIHERYHH